MLEFPYRKRIFVYIITRRYRGLQQTCLTGKKVNINPKNTVEIQIATYVVYTQLFMSVVLFTQWVISSTAINNIAQGWSLDLPYEKNEKRITSLKEMDKKPVVINISKDLVTSFRGTGTSGANFVVDLFTGQHYRATLRYILRAGRSGLSALRKFKIQLRYLGLMTIRLEFVTQKTLKRPKNKKS